MSTASLATLGDFEELKASVDPKHPRLGAAVLSVEQLYSGSKRLE